MNKSAKYLLTGIFAIAVGSVIYNCDEQKVTEGGYLRHKAGGSILTIIGIASLLNGIYLKMK